MKALLTLRPYFWKYRNQLLLGVLFVVTSNVFSLFPARLVREGFDRVSESIEQVKISEEGDPSNLQRTLIIYGLLLFGSALARGLFMFFMRQTIIVVSRRIEFDLKNALFEHYQKLSLAFYKRNKTGDLMNRMSEDVSRVRMFLGPAVMYSINVVSQLVLIIGVMLSINVELTLYALAPLPLLSVAIYKVSHYINVRSEKVQRKLSDISSFVQESFSGIRVLKAYGKEGDFSNEFAKECGDYKDENMNLVRVNALFMPLMTLLIGLSTIITIYIGGRLAIQGIITTGNIAEFVIYVGMLTWPVASLGWVTSIVQRAEASQERINEFLHVVPEIQNLREEPSEIKGHIVFDKVNFTYPDSGIQAIKNLSFDLPAGKSLALIGKTGSGKSTVGYLISRLYSVSSGRITIDQTPIEHLNLDSLRSGIGYVPQEAFLFSDSIGANIGFGVDQPDAEAIQLAAKNADVHQNIMDFPKGYDTMVGERGVTLSGGQKQRISIARAILKKPEILIFDDCLSAVDTQTEEEILNNLKDIMEHKTSIIISHRLSSVKHCDEILVLEDGEVVERGTHESLLQRNGAYAELFEKQQLERHESA